MSKLLIMVGEIICRALIGQGGALERLGLLARVEPRPHSHAFIGRAPNKRPRYLKIELGLEDPAHFYIGRESPLPYLVE